MARQAYVDGRFLALGAPAVPVEDRALQFSEGVYEVIALVDGQPVDQPAHLERLARSAAALGLPPPPGAAALAVVLAETARRNRVREGWIYIQWTGGVAPRDFAPAIRPAHGSLIVYARRKPVAARARAVMAAKGVAAITTPDLRWRRRDIKSVSLLGAAMAKRKALEAGAFEAIQYEADGRVTEGASSNVWIVDAAGVLRTPPASPDLLNGVTRRVALAIAGERGQSVVEGWFDLAALRAAREVFLTSATALVAPVTRLDGAPVGDGAPGPFAGALLQRYLELDRRPGPTPP